MNIFNYKIDNRIGKMEIEINWFKCVLKIFISLFFIVLLCGSIYLFFKFIDFLFLFVSIILFFYLYQLIFKNPVIYMKCSLKKPMSNCYSNKNFIEFITYCLEDEEQFLDEGQFLNDEYENYYRVEVYLKNLLRFMKAFKISGRMRHVRYTKKIKKNSWRKNMIIVE